MTEPKRPLPLYAFWNETLQEYERDRVGKLITTIDEPTANWMATNLGINCAPVTFRIVKLAEAVLPVMERPCDTNL